MGKYDDIINLTWPQSTGRTRMPLEKRAKIFLPFAALKGYEESLENERQITVPKSELSEDRKSQINEVLKMIEKKLNSKIKVNICVTYFIPEKDFENGRYETINGAVEKIRMEEQFIKILSKEIAFENISEIKITVSM